jgi:hypothetical protein
MQSPIREQVRLADRWQARQENATEASVFVPGPWGGKQVILVGGEGQALADVRVGGSEPEPGSEPNSWVANTNLTPGGWNQVKADGDLSGARLEASNPLHIARLEATVASERSLSVRVRITDAVIAEAPPEGGEAPCLLSAGLLSLFFTLTTPEGRQVSGMEVMLGRRTREISIEMPSPEPLSGSYRLKAALGTDEYVIDNARIDLVV